MNLEEVFSNMLKREMQALGVFNTVETEKEVVLSEPDFVWSDVPYSKLVN